MGLSSKLKQALASREPTLGTWLSIGHTAVAEVVCQAGFDWVVVDMEHSATTSAQMLRLIQVIDLSGLPALVRVGANEPLPIKQAMDAGAAGVIVPMVNSAEDARRAVASVKYPTEGSRGVGLSRAQGWGFGFDEYVKALASDSVVIAQIEHIDAIRDLEAILAMPGIDGTLIGPYDLSGSLGFPGQFDRPEVRAALERYESVCHAAGKPLGAHSVQPDAGEARSHIERGYTFLAVGVDFLYLGRKCRDVLGELRA
jgi:2-keto-3-deoxy-L-rhamnonate aldolase RhmA